MNFYDDVDNVKTYIRMCEGYDAEAQLKTMFKTVQSGVKLLELGSGPGNDLALLLNEYEVTGSDNSSAFLDVLKNRFPDLDILKLDAISISADKKFDVIFSNKVFQHLNDEDLRKSVNRQADILTPGGYVYHLIWQKIESPDENFGLDFIPRSQAQMRQILADKFEVLSMKAFAEFEDNDSLAILAKKK